MNDKLNNGIILLAQPFMDDTNFKRSAILLVDHSDEGSVGFILNRQLNIRVDDLIDDFPEFDAPVFYGGPVGRDTVHYLHTKGDLLEGSDEVSPGVFWGGDYNQLRFLASQGVITPYDVRFYVGYSGWSEGQLEDEMLTGTWLTAQSFPNYVFKSPSDSLWSTIMKNKGKHFSVIGDIQEELCLN